MTKIYYLFTMLLVVYSESREALLGTVSDIIKSNKAEVFYLGKCSDFTICVEGMLFMHDRRWLKMLKRLVVVVKGGGGC